MAHYKLGGIEISGVRNLIVCDASRNPCSQDHACCSCALMTLANYLIISGRAKFHDRVEGEDVTVVDIRNMVARIVATTADAALSPKFLSTLRSASTAGIHMDPIFESPIMFSDTDERRLFMHLSVQLLHSYVIDPSQSVLYNSCHSMSLDEMIKRVGGRDDRFEKVKNLMRKVGLQFLPQVVDEGGLAVLYTDTHFSIIHKYKGAIFTLETDDNVLTNLPGATWKALDMRHKFYLTSQYKPTSKQPKFNQAQEWCDAKLAKDLRESAETAEMRDERNAQAVSLVKSKKKGRGPKADDEAESSNESDPIPAISASDKTECLDFRIGTSTRKAG